MTDYKVVFLKDAQVERAPKNGGPGVEIETIAAGTEKVLSDRSVKFWKDRENKLGVVIKVLGKAREDTPRLTASPDANIQDPPPPPAQAPTKVEIKKVAETALTLLQSDLRETAEPLAEALGLLTTADVKEVLSLPKDTVMVLECAIDDLGRGPSLAQPKEVEDAIREVIDLTLPPSRRRNRS